MVLMQQAKCTALEQRQGVERHGSVVIHQCFLPYHMPKRGAIKSQTDISPKGRIQPRQDGMLVRSRAAYTC